MNGAEVRVTVQCWSRPTQRIQSNHMVLAAFLLLLGLSLADGFVSLSSLQAIKEPSKTDSKIHNHCFSSFRSRRVLTFKNRKTVLQNSDQEFEDYDSGVRNITGFIPPKLSGLRPIGTTCLSQTAVIHKRVSDMRLLVVLSSLCTI